jgi:transcriptional antiterminator RfaH
MSFTEHDIEADAGSRWYALHTRPREESRASSNLLAWNVETFAPRFKECRRNQFTGKPTYTAKALFPRYIFARFPLSMLHKVRFTRGVQSVVSFGGQYAPVEDEVIEVIRAQEADDGFVRVGEEFKAGDKVRIKEGPMRDLIGVFERELEDEARVMLLLTMLNYQAHVVVEREAVAKVQQAYGQSLTAVATGNGRGTYARPFTPRVTH